MIWAVLAVISRSYFPTAAASSTSILAFFFRDPTSSCWCNSEASPVSCDKRSMRSMSARLYWARTTAAVAEEERRNNK